MNTRYVSACMPYTLCVPSVKNRSLYWHLWQSLWILLLEPRCSGTVWVLPWVRWYGTPRLGSSPLVFTSSAIFSAAVPTSPVWTSAERQWVLNMHIILRKTSTWSFLTLQSWVPFGVLTNPLKLNSHLLRILMVPSSQASSKDEYEACVLRVSELNWEWT